MLKLGVNIDHVATLRQARYRNQTHGEPDPVAAALQCEAAGAHGITAHLREDRRHIQDADIRRLRQALQTRLNFELANSPEIVAFAIQIQPDIVCLVPERREELTTEGGLDVRQQQSALAETTRRFADAGIPVSLFVDPDPNQVRAAARTGAGFVELHTGRYAEAFHDPLARANALDRLREAAEVAHAEGLEVNAGHGLNCQNLPALLGVPHLVELNIGHSIVSRALNDGLSAAVREILRLMSPYPR